MGGGSEGKTQNTSPGVCAALASAPIRCMKQAVPGGLQDTVSVDSMLVSMGRGFAE